MVHLSQEDVSTLVTLANSLTDASFTPTDLLLIFYMEQYMHMCSRGSVICFKMTCCLGCRDVFLKVLQQKSQLHALLPELNFYAIF